MAYQGNIKTNYKSGLTCHYWQYKGHLSYECKSPAPVSWDESAEHLNPKDNTPEEVPYFHFINLVDENSDAYIKKSMFGDDDYPVETNSE